MELDKYLDLKKKLTKLQREADNNAGALKLLKQRLKDEFECDNLRDAKKLLTKLEQEESELSQEFAKSLNQFNTEWDHVLKELDH